MLAAQKQIQNTARGEALGAKGCRRGVRKGSSADQAEGGCKAPGAPPADRGGRGRRVDFRGRPSRQRKCDDSALWEGTDSLGNCERFGALEQKAHVRKCWAEARERKELAQNHLPAVTRNVDTVSWRMKGSNFNQGPTGRGLHFQKPTLRAQQSLDREGTRPQTGRPVRWPEQEPHPGNAEGLGKHRHSGRFPHRNRLAGKCLTVGTGLEGNTKQQQTVLGVIFIFL